MKYLKAYESFDKQLKKYVEIKLLNLLLILEILSNHDNIITVKKLYTYDTVKKTLSSNDEVVANLEFDIFTKNSIVDQSDNIDELVEPLKKESDITKYNL
jgi:hypothetical protein